MSDNEALEARGIFELLSKVGYVNDHMYDLDNTRSPYGFNVSSNLSSNGDIGTFTFTGAESYFEYPATVPVELSTDDYPYLICRYKVVGDSNFQYGVKYNDGSSELWSGSSTVWVTESQQMSAGLTPSSLIVHLKGTVYIDYIAIAGYTPHSLEPVSFEINRAITDEIDSAILTVDYESVSDVEDRLLSSHLKIYLAKDTLVTSNSFHKVFSGIVESVKKEIKGHSPRKLEIEAFGYGSYLRNKTLKYGKHLTGYIHEVVQGFVQPLVDEGLIVTRGIDTFTDSISYGVKSNSYLGDVLEDLAEKYDCDFYVGLGGDLLFFRRGVKESSTNIDVDETHEFPYEEDIKSLINYQEIIGAPVGTIGSDSEWTESLDNWSSSGVLALDDDIKTTGYYSVRSSISSGDLYVDLDVDGLDLSLAGVLHFDLQYRAMVDVHPSSFVVGVYFISDDGTFEVLAQPSGGVSSRRSLHRYDHSNYELPEEPYDMFYYYPFRPFEVAFNLKSAIEETESGNTIDWGNISTIRIKIENPADVKAVLWIDNMYISDVHISSTISDSTSISKYGKHEGVPYGPDESLDSIEKCELLGSLLVGVYKDPIRSAQDVKTLKGFDFVPGYEYTLTVKEMENVPVILRSIRYEGEGMNFDTYLSFSRRHIPSPERLIARAKKELDAYGWRIEAWKRARFSATGAIPTRSEEIEFWEANLEFPWYVFLDQRFIVAIAPDESKYVIEKTSNASGSITFGPTFHLGTGELSYGQSGTCSIYPLASEDAIKKDLNSGFRARLVILTFSPLSSAIFIGMGTYNPATNTNRYGFIFYEDNQLDVEWKNSAGQGERDSLMVTSLTTLDLWAVYSKDEQAIDYYVNGTFQLRHTNVQFDGDLFPFFIQVSDSGPSVEDATTACSIRVEGLNIIQGWKET